jgi:hypothetical protein
MPENGERKVMGKKREINVEKRESWELEMRGIDPRTSRMLSERSTI